MDTRKEFIDKLDAEIMDWFYECCRINFGVDGMIQDSTELRAIIEEAFDSLFSKKGEAFRKAYQMGHSEAVREVRIAVKNLYHRGSAYPVTERGTTIDEVLSLPQLKILK